MRRLVLAEAGHRRCQESGGYPISLSTGLTGPKACKSPEAESRKPDSSTDDLLAACSTTSMATMGGRRSKDGWIASLEAVVRDNPATEADQGVCVLGCRWTSKCQTAHSSSVRGAARSGVCGPACCGLKPVRDMPGCSLSLAVAVVVRHRSLFTFVGDLARQPSHGLRLSLSHTHKAS